MAVFVWMLKNTTSDAIATGSGRYDVVKYFVVVLAALRLAFKGRAVTTIVFFRKFPCDRHEHPMPFHSCCKF
ncbi:MAG: hypothetical protein GWO26_03200 [Phycisphaerae bacterium]|nr:hypothetical protein [Phycisphaerae bacterium]